MAKADSLAEVASKGEMALFVGAGVSMSAKLPSWGGLLTDIAKGELSPPELEEAKSLSTLDFAQLLANTLGERALQERVVNKIKPYTRASFTHALLAALPVKEIVTTNYDNLFEYAAEDADRKVTVIPEKGAISSNERWLMKLHGSVDDAKDVVLSRNTFLQYEASRGALAGLLAGVLLTRHVVFVGSSFTDDNVLRITEEVQRLDRMYSGDEAIGRRVKPSLGTCLAVGLSSLQAKLWKRDFDWIDMGKEVLAGGRTLSIFLDRMLASASNSASYLFDDAFGDTLTEEEKKLRGALLTLFTQADSLDHPAVKTQVEQLSQRLGWPPKPPKSTPQG